MEITIFILAFTVATLTIALLAYCVVHVTKLRAEIEERGLACCGENCSCR